VPPARRPLSFATRPGTPASNQGRKSKTRTEEAFFARGKTIASLADVGKPIPSEWIISFGDPADLLKVLTSARLELIRALKSGPSSLDNKSLHEIAKTTGLSRNTLPKWVRETKREVKPQGIDPRKD
jgi:predicted transcriptional regulator